MILILGSDLSEVQDIFPVEVLCPQMPEPLRSPSADLRSLHRVELNWALGTPRARSQSFLGGAARDKLPLLSWDMWGL